MSDEEETPQTRLPLANDVHGDPIDMPASAVAWRVRRASGKPGRPHNVYDVDGKQLEIPLTSTVDDLRENGCGPGRYRLEAVSNDGRLIGGIVAFTEILDDGTSTEPATAAATRFDDCSIRSSARATRFVARSKPWPMRLVPWRRRWDQSRWASPQANQCAPINSWRR